MEIEVSFLIYSFKFALSLIAFFAWLYVLISIGMLAFDDNIVWPHLNTLERIGCGILTFLIFSLMPYALDRYLRED